MSIINQTCKILDKVDVIMKENENQNKIMQKDRKAMH